ncbi:MULTISPECIES: hypothetical protein [Actinomadura]|uniref:Transmembrane protein n=1 Tax=Actinomadura miaoliensis TaxID=430685 RepID=A0ABP7WMH1_9ACTN
MKANKARKSSNKARRPQRRTSRIGTWAKWSATGLTAVVTLAGSIAAIAMLRSWFARPSTHRRDWAAATHGDRREEAQRASM